MYFSGSISEVGMIRLPTLTPLDFRVLASLGEEQVILIMLNLLIVVTSVTLTLLNWDMTCSRSLVG